MRQGGRKDRNRNIGECHPSENEKEFYVNCDMVPMGTEADVFGVRMELLGIRCHLDFEGYRNFYRESLSPWAAEHIREVRL